MLFLLDIHLTLQYICNIFKRHFAAAVFAAGSLLSGGAAYSLFFCSCLAMGIEMLLFRCYNRKEKAFGNKEKNL